MLIDTVTQTIQKALRTHLPLTIDGNADEYLDEHMPSGYRVSASWQSHNLVWRRRRLDNAVRNLQGDTLSETVEYEIFCTAPTEGIDYLLNRVSQQIDDALTGYETTLDGYRLVFNRIGPWVRRYVQDGVWWYELGHVYSVWCRPDAGLNTMPPNHAVLLAGDKLNPAALHPYLDRIDFYRVAHEGDPNLLATERLELYGHYAGDNVIRNFYAYWMNREMSFVFGPEGDDPGMPRVSGATYIKEWHSIYDNTGDATNAVQFTATLEMPLGSDWTTYTESPDGA